MNSNFVRRVTSSIFASLFTLSVGIGGVQFVRAEDTKRLDFCKQHRNLFHINKGAERKVKLAVLDFQSSTFEIKVGDRRQTSPIEITGLGSVLESKLVKDDKLDVVKWNQIGPLHNSSDPASTNQLQKLRQIRDKNGVEGVIIVTVMQFETNKEYEGGLLITNKNNNQEVDIKLNLQVVDTTIGKIILEAQGHGSEKANTLTEINLPFEVSIHRKTDGKYNSEDKKVK